MPATEIFGRNHSTRQKLWYKEAIARDPNFALAIAQLAICRLRRHWLTDPLSDAEVIDAGNLAKQALALAPDLAEAHVAMGVFHYYGFRDYEPALTEFQRAIELRPNNSEALQFIAAVHRRQGKWNATLDELKQSLDQDPRDANIAGTIAETHSLLRNWKAAEEMAGHSLAIDPHEALGMRVLLLSSLNRTGNAEEPLRLLASFPPVDLLIPNTGTYDMVIGTRAGSLGAGSGFQISTYRMGHSHGCDDQRKTAVRGQSCNSCPGRRHYRRTNGSGESARAIGSKTARPSTGYSFVASIELGLPRA